MDPTNPRAMGQPRPEEETQGVLDAVAIHAPWAPGAGFMPNRLGKRLKIPSSGSEPHYLVTGLYLSTPNQNLTLQCHPCSGSSLGDPLPAWEHRLPAGSRQVLSSSHSTPQDSRFFQVRGAGSRQGCADPVTDPSLRTMCVFGIFAGHASSLLYLSSPASTFLS